MKFSIAQMNYSLDKVLIVNPFGIGDVLFTTPVLSALKKQIPGAEIGYLCNKRTQELVRSNPNVKRVFVFEKDEYRQLWRQSKVRCIKKFLRFLAEVKAERFDAALDFSLNSQYGFFLWLTGIPRRIGYDYKNRGRFLTDRIKLAAYSDKHVVEYYKDLLGHIGVNTEGGAPQLDVPEDDEKWALEFLRQSGVDEKSPLVGIVPGGGASWGKDAIYKQWRKDGFAMVGDRLAEKYDARVLVAGDNADYGVCQSVADAMKHKPLLACGNMSVLKFAALLKRCSVIICNDGGPLHVAAAAGARTASIFGPVDERVYGPYPDDPPSPVQAKSPEWLRRASGRHAVVKSNAKCRPCYKNFKFTKCGTIDCLNSISPEQVIEAVDKLIRK